MKLFKGVICIVKNKNEWDYTIPNFAEQLKIALGVKKGTSLYFNRRNRAKYIYRRWI